MLFLLCSRLSINWSALQVTGGYLGVIAVLPARYDSSRFAGKPLANQTGKYLIQHVYEQVCQARLVNEVIVATDDERIRKACDEFGACCQMTRKEHPSGTDRVAEVAERQEADIIVNIQGDEPEIEPGNIDQAVELLQQDAEADISTLCSRFSSMEEVNNPNVVKVVIDKQGHALYFSRWGIPYQRDGQEKAALKLYRKHLGLYAYRREVLLKLCRYEPTELEKAEKLEQLRALEYGMKIAVEEVEHGAVGIDTPEQYQAYVERVRENR